MFKEPNAKIREALAWVMARICEHHSDVVSTPMVAGEFIPRLMDGIKDKPRISNQCCSAFEKLGIQCQPFSDE